MILLSSINRTFLARFLTIAVAEHLLKWVEPGTHDFSKYQSPEELTEYLQSHHFQVAHIQGVTYSPLERQWVQVPCHMVNYFLTARKAQTQ